MKDNFFQLDLKPFFGLFQVPKNLILDIWSITKKMSFFSSDKGFFENNFSKGVKWSMGWIEACPSRKYGEIKKVQIFGFFRK